MALTKENILCPSSKAQVGAKLIGMVTEDGHVNLLHTPLPVTKEFLEVANKSYIPESRFRFTNACMEGKCKQWSGHHCTVIDHVFDAIEGKIAKTPIPECGIRPQCRWYNQTGEEACKVCTLVVTNTADIPE